MASESERAAQRLQTENAKLAHERSEWARSATALSADLARVTAERDAALAALASLRKALRRTTCICIGRLTYGGDRALWEQHLANCTICQDDEALMAALAATADLATAGAKVIEEAEERGARWMRGRWLSRVNDPGLGSAGCEAPEVCRAARRGGR